MYKSFPFLHLSVFELCAMRDVPIIHNSLITVKHGSQSCFPDGLFLVFLAYCRPAELSPLTQQLDRFPLLFPFFAVSCSKELFPPFEHDRFDIQDRQFLPASYVSFQ